MKDVLNDGKSSTTHVSTGDEWTDEEIQVLDDVGERNKTNMDKERGAGMGARVPTCILLACEVYVYFPPPYL